MEWFAVDVLNQSVRKAPVGEELRPRPIEPGDIEPSTGPHLHIATDETAHRKFDRFCLRIHDTWLRVHFDQCIGQSGCSADHGVFGHGIAEQFLGDPAHLVVIEIAVRRYTAAVDTAVG